MQDVQSVVDSADNQAADDHREDASFTAEEAGAANDGAGDGVGFKAHAGQRFRRPEAGGGDHARQPGANAGNDEHQQHVELDVDAGVESGVLVTAQRVDVAAHAHTGGQEPQDHRHNQREDHRNRNAQRRGGEKVNEIKRKPVHRVGIRDHQRNTAEDGVGAEGNNERMQAGPVDQAAVDGPQRAADQHAANQRREERVDARQHQLRGDHPGEREDRPDRQVDPGDEDREELAHADQDGDRALDEDLRNIVGRQEVL